jgi:hypothetical protein
MNPAAQPDSAQAAPESTVSSAPNIAMKPAGQGECRRPRSLPTAASGTDLYTLAKRMRRRIIWRAFVLSTLESLPTTVCELSIAASAVGKLALLRGARRCFPLGECPRCQRRLSFLVQLECIGCRSTPPPADFHHHPHPHPVGNTYNSQFH